MRIKDVLARKQNNEDIFSQLMFGEVALAAATANQMDESENFL